jgi:hypothetical protein
MMPKEKYLFDELNEPEPEPWVDPAPVEFDITLEDGTKQHVKFSYLGKNIPHFEYRGEGISETGYRSEFPGHGIIPENEIKEYAIAIAERVRADHLVFLKKAERKNRRGKARKPEEGK